MALEGSEEPMLSVLRTHLEREIRRLSFAGFLAAFFILMGSGELLAGPSGTVATRSMGFGGLVLSFCLIASILFTLRVGRLVLTSWLFTALSWAVIVIFNARL